MTSRRGGLWVLALLCFNLPAEDLSLDNAVEMAIRHNGSIANAQLEVRKAGDRIAQLRTRLLPSLNFYGFGSQQLRAVDFTFDRGVLGVYPGIGPVPAEDTRVRTPLKPTAFLFGRVVQPLSPIYRIKLNLKTLDTSARIAEEQLREQRQDVIRNVKRLYYGIQQMESALRAAEETTKLYRELDRLVGDYVSQQVALKSEHLQVQSRLAKIEETTLTLRNGQASLKEQLNQILGRDVLTDFSIKAMPEASEFEMDAEAARRKALENRSELRQAKLRVEQARQDVRAKRAEYIPDIAAEFNSITLVNFNRFLPVQVNSAGLSVTWEVFDWGRKRAEMSEKRHVAQQAKNAERDAESLIIIDVNDKLRRLQQARAHLRTTRLARETALESLRVVKNRFQVQASLLRDVLEAQASLEQANAEFVQATSDFWTAKAEFERATGEDR